jgi:succinate dehydrogenase hydrophobic anchor subunit
MIYHSWDHLLSRYLGRKRVNQMRMNWLVRASGIFLTFNAVAFAFLFFRLDTQRLQQLLEALLK